MDYTCFNYTVLNSFIFDVQFLFIFIRVIISRFVFIQRGDKIPIQEGDRSSSHQGNGIIIIHILI